VAVRRRYHLDRELSGYNTESMNIDQRVPLSMYIKNIFVDCEKE
jgi:hypothetical protein